MADGTLNIDANDPQQLGRLAAGLPPVLPSLAKPQPSAQPPMGMPPVAGPTPEEQALAPLRAKVAAIQKQPTATERLQQKAGAYEKEHPGIVGRLGQVGAGILRGVDIGAEILAPNIARNVPGTAFNRAQRAGEAQKALASAETQAGQASERAYKGAEIPKMQAETAKLKRETELLGEPKPKEEKWEGVAAPGGGPLLDPQTGKALEREQNSGQYRWSEMGGIPAQVKPGEEPLNKQDTATSNSTWNGLIAEANKQLPKGQQIPLNQFREGMTPKQVQETEQRLSQATGRQQGAVKLDLSVDKAAQAKTEQENRLTAIQMGINGLAEPNLLKMFDDPVLRAAFANAVAPAIKQIGAYVPGVGGFQIPGATVDAIATQLATKAGNAKAQDFYKLVDAYNVSADQAINFLIAQQGGKVGRGGQAFIDRVMNLIPGPTTASSAQARDKLNRWQSQYNIWKKGHNISVPSALEGGTPGDGAAPETRVYQGVTYTKQPDGTWAR